MTSCSTGRIFSCASSSVAARVVILSRTLPWPASGATVGSLGVEELLDLLRERRLAYAGEVERLGDDGALAAGPDQGLQRLPEHALHLRGHPRERGKKRPLPLHERPHRRPYGVRDKLRPLGEQRLLVVVRGRLAAEPLEHLVHVFAGFGVLDHLAARQGREAGVRQVVRGRAQAARSYHQGGAGGGFA